ncbi:MULTISPECIES: ABC transporter ATP-binding protein/permease [Methylobacterium]|uniref:Vitamin B12 import ATP-binding protein BtuD n=3 Tax=Pseudomonadota TaxID=1224 RepID=A0ABQ4T3M0_9HYPH|nr:MULTISPECIES: ABC transporter ATP-binding protein/permease [Methylobacterium]PIU04493.1 MAG: ABC transporter [Methylobacterium sp. CG09_land_8_20_14_0_10_71_15]PIU16549.1 MAG: ABC transporter [Methylobacterium sp. CG08_land_8_20_14_0_20_71_15]GBU19737.1 ATP-binding protein [Methylobacterium sp.]GJE08868.1 Vitamin B12 import ATP-binding protein BtuD [Methylobacterium jeotgali]
MPALRTGLGLQAVLTGLFALALLAAPGLPSPPLYVSVAGLVMAGILLASANLSAYLKVFVSVYGIGYVFLAGGKLLAALEVLPRTVAALFPPDFAATGAVVFAAIVLGISHLRAIRAITDITDPYFTSRDAPTTEIGPFRFLGATEGRIGQRLVALSIFITFAQVALQLRLNFWYRDLFNALQEYNAEVFWYQLVWVFCPLATIWVIIGMLDVFVDESLFLRWRTWLTRSFYGRWLDGGTHYRIPFTGEDADNPDQRIQSDVNLFIRQTTSLSIRLLSQAATLVSFMVILWSLSRDFVLPFTDTVVPGFLVWLVVGYAVVGTWLTHVIGRPLIGLDFNQEKVEADFRFSLARSRIFSEQIALLRGERAEINRLGGLFGAIISNYLGIVYRRIKLGSFTLSYSQISVVFPYILAAPSYFLKKITLGQFQQTADAFSSVQSSLSFFINAYTTIASYKANTNRLASFKRSMTRAEALAGAGHGVVQGNATGSDVTATGLGLALPDGREIVSADSLRLEKGAATLVTGPSGSGKSTLFRAIAGIWPLGRGRVDVPAGQSALVLPQRPYIPLGTLRGAVVYPNTTDQFADEAIREALGAAQLGHLADRLDEIDAWDRRLSGGEQQRLAIARALLAKPDWLFLDEATAALDEPSEADLYAMLRKRLPGTTIVSIGHRSTLHALHERRIDMGEAQDGRYRPQDVRSPIPAQ